MMERAGAALANRNQPAASGRPMLADTGAVYAVRG